MTTLHIYTGRERGEKWFKPWQWHKALEKRECPDCKEKVYLEMLELGHCLWCLNCKVCYFMPVLGLGLQSVWRTEPDFKRTLNFLRRKAYYKACDTIDDWGRDITTGRFTKQPEWQTFSHWGWERALAAITAEGEA